MRAVAVGLGVLFLAGVEIAKAIPSLQEAVASPYFNVARDAHDFLTLTLVLYVAYRWRPGLGAAGLALYVVAHVPNLLLSADARPPDIIRLSLGTTIGLGGILMIARVRRMQDETDERNLRLESLYHMSQEMGLSLDLPTIGARALDAALNTLKLDAGTIRYVDEASQELVMLTHRGLPPDLTREIDDNPRLKIGQGIAGKAAASGEPLVIESVSQYPDTAYRATRDSGLGSAASLPLKVKGTVVGVITGFAQKPRTFTAGDLELMASLGNMVGMAISNSRLFRTIETKGREWEQTFDSVSEGIALLTPDYKIMRANRTLARMLNSTPHELVGQHCYRAIHGTGEPTTGCPASQCMAGKQPSDAVFQEPRLGNRWLEERVDPVLDHNGELLSVVHTTMDISERKKAEEALSKSLSLTGAILDMVRIASKGLVTRDVYTAFAARLRDLVHFDEASMNLLDHVDKVYRVFTVRAGDEVLVTSGQITDLEGSATAWLVSQNRTQIEDDIARERQLDSDERLAQAGYRAVLRVPLSFRDQTFGTFELESRLPGIYGTEERKAIEQLCSVLASILWYQHLVALEVMERQELEEMDKAREQFVSFLAHELRTPLTPIKASALLLAEHIPREAGTPEHRCIRNIVTGARDLEARLSDLLNMAQYRIGAFTLQIETVDPRALLCEAASRFEPLAQSRGQSLVTDVPATLPPLRADGSRLEQVVANLLDNASKFTPQDGSIRMGAAVRDGELVIEVQDNGPGLSAEEQRKIFQPYWRGAPENQRLPGTGLGLALCKRLVEAHGGRIWVESETGRGSIFCFALSLSGPASRAGERP
ncbi:MAG: GAF domain-containing protein [Chloroflexi bacterium]|nr:GAF domain-containing protein [Chloroflexota bacterium]